MKVTLAIVPPDGGEQDYQIDATLEFLPRAGEYLYLNETESLRVRAFLVRNVFHQGLIPEEGKAVINSVVLEVEFIEHPFQSDSHKQSADMYKARGYKVKEAPVTAY